MRLQPPSASRVWNCWMYVRQVNLKKVTWKQLCRPTGATRKNLRNAPQRCRRSVRFIFIVSRAHAAMRLENGWQKKGFTIIHLQGGYAAWQRAGKPVSAATSAEPIDWDQLKASFPVDQPVLLDVGADWCPPCRQMLPIIDSLEKTAAGQYRIIRIDASEQPLLAAKLQAESYPTFILYKNGKETWRHVGAIGLTELKARLEE